MRVTCLTLCALLAAASLRAQGAVDTSSTPVTMKGGGGSVSDPLIVADVQGTTSVCSIGPRQTADAVCLLADSIEFEGATADDFEATLTVTDPTADRTYTFPNATGNVVLASAAINQSITGTTTIGPIILVGNSSVTANAELGWGSGAARQDYNTALTPDSMYFGLAAVGRSYHFGDVSDRDFDFNNGPCGTSACTDPTLIIHSVNQSLTEYMSLSHDQTVGEINSPGGVRFVDAGTQPTCDAAHEGAFWFDAGGAGVTSTVDVCLKAAADTYSWVEIANGG